MEVELKRLEDLSEAIVQDFARMRKNEEEMRDTNGMIENIKDIMSLLTKIWNIYLQKTLKYITFSISIFNYESLLQNQNVKASKCNRT